MSGLNQEVRKTNPKIIMDLRISSEDFMRTRILAGLRGWWVLTVIFLLFKEEMSNKRKLMAVFKKLLISSALFKKHSNMSTLWRIFLIKTFKVLQDSFMFCLELGPLIVISLLLSLKNMNKICYKKVILPQFWILKYSSMADIRSRICIWQRTEY